MIFTGWLSCLLPPLPNRPRRRSRPRPLVSGLAIEKAVIDRTNRMIRPTCEEVEDENDDEEDWNMTLNTYRCLQRPGAASSSPPEIPSRAAVQRSSVAVTNKQSRHPLGGR